MTRSRTLCLLALTCAATTVVAQDVTARKAAKNIERVTSVIDWRTDLEAARSEAAENGKLVFWMQIVGELPGGL